MRSSRINYVVVGGFVLAMLVALVVVLAVLTGRSGASDRYFIVFDNVAGLKFGSQVLYEGFPVGQVEHIEPITDAGRLRFRVEVSVIRGWRVPDDSVARVSAPGILSALVVDIEGGKSTAFLAHGARIASAPGGDMLSLMTSLADEVTDLSRTRIKPLLARIAELVDEFGTVMEPSMIDVAQNLRVVAAEFAAAAPQAAGDLKGFLQALNDAGARLRILLADDNMERIENILGNMENSSESFDQMVRDMRASLDDLGHLAATLNKLADQHGAEVGDSVRDARHVLDSVARRIDAITNNLEGTSQNFYEFSRQIRGNPGLLLGGATPERGPAEPPGRGRPAP